MGNVKREIKLHKKKNEVLDLLAPISFVKMGSSMDSPQYITRAI
jgi:hypothetical protein